MRCRLFIMLTALGVLFPAIAAASAGPSLSVAPGNEHFLRTWERTDRPVLEGLAMRTWMWGPEANTNVLTEPYSDAPGGQRQVQYFDKSRMEITAPDADPDSIWYVTNGLLVVELISGHMQVGDANFQQRAPADTPVAGDADDEDGPTYASLAGLLDEPPAEPGATITRHVNRAGVVTDNQAVAELGVTIAYIDDVTNHAIAAPFWEFMNSSGPIWEAGQLTAGQLFENEFFATGRPITEAYGATVKVAGTVQLVVLQCFERRCLTYTPQNAPEWQVEAGNVGQHYYQWRYEGDQEPPVANDAALINEVKFWPLDGLEQWVEIHNPTEDPIDLAGYQLTNGAGDHAATLPGVVMPPGSYLVVHFSEGTDDLDLGDLRGDYYDASAPEAFFAEEFDEAALYSGVPGVDTIIDFLAWSYHDAYAGQVAFSHAVDAGIWEHGDYFDATRRHDVDLVHPVSQGETIGRDADSTDTNTVGDWAELGGEDALGETPRLRNLHQITPPAPDEPPPPPPAGGQEWTVMVFADGRSNRATLKAVLQEINKMELSGSNADVSIVAQIAWRGGPGDTTSAARWYLNQGSDPARLESPAIPLEPGDVANPGNPQALAGFISWAEAHYPADKYAMVLIGHGQGWKGTMLSGANADFLTMSELETGLSALSKKFEVVEFESCLMGQVEVGYQIEPAARMMVASEEVVWAVLPWQAFFDELKDNPGWSAGEYADRKAELNAAAHADSRGRAVRGFFTMASVDLEQLAGQLIPRIDTFATDLRADVEDVKEHDFVPDNGQILIKHEAQEQAEDFSDTNFKDLYHFAELVEPLPLAAAASAGPVLDVLAEGGPVIRWEAHGALNSNAHGLSLYFPHDLLAPDGVIGSDDQALTAAQREMARYPNAPTGHLKVDSFDDPKYDPATSDTHLYKLDANILLPRLAGESHAMEDDPDFAFPNAATWDEFLHRYYKPVADACIVSGDDCVEEITVEIGAEVTLSGLGSSDSDGPEDAVLGESGNDVPAHAAGPAHYYWDFNATQDNPAPLPVYSEGIQYAECDVEDCDRDELDEPDDDRDAVGQRVAFVCAAPGSYEIRLTVWDEHHDQVRTRQEDERHNEGRHWLHFNVHSDTVTVSCGQSGIPPVKEADKEVVAPGEYITYTILMPANAALEEQSEGTIIDPIQVEFFDSQGGLVIQNLSCNIGECFYEDSTNDVIWTGALAPSDVVEMSFMLLVPEDLLPEEYPEEYLNCIQGYDGVAEFFDICATTAVELPDTEPPSTSSRLR